MYTRAGIESPNQHMPATFILDMLGIMPGWSVSLDNTFNWRVRWVVLEQLLDERQQLRQQVYLELG
jgi:hypothetical protein